MTPHKKQNSPNWFMFALIMGPALGLITGELVWCLTGAIVLGFVAEGLRPKSDASDRDTDVHKDAA